MPETGCGPSPQAQGADAYSERQRYLKSESPAAGV